MLAQSILPSLIPSIAVFFSLYHFIRLLFLLLFFLLFLPTLLLLCELLLCYPSPGGGRCVQFVAEFTHPLIVSIPSIMFHPLIRGTSPYSLISRSPTLSLLVPLYLSQFLHLSLSLGISFLSAFYSKSNRKAFIQPNLSDSGYIWFA